MKKGAMSIRVLIVDDSALARELLSEFLNRDPDLEVVGTARDPIVARNKIKKLRPDVLTLDVEMPRMDGITFLERLMRLRPMPVVMVSKFTQTGAETTLKALELGAVDFVAKPSGDLQAGLQDQAQLLCDKVKLAARAQVRRIGRVAEPLGDVDGQALDLSDRLIAIGSSTGGVEAVHVVLEQLPGNCPPVVLAQHMPGSFTGPFAARLNQLCMVTVKEADDREPLLAGHVYIAPGESHMRLERQQGSYICRLDDGPLAGGVRPSVDVLFNSVAECAMQQAIGVILTGMGRDGAEGLLAMREVGALTLGQDEASCVVYGMPRVAWEIGAVQRQLPLERIAGAILAHCGALQAG